MRKIEQHGPVVVVSVRNVDQSDWNLFINAAGRSGKSGAEFLREKIRDAADAERVRLRCGS